MEETVYNPQKGRLEAVQVEYTKENTTWFDNYEEIEDIYMITDYKGGIIIKEYNHNYPVWIYDYARADIGNDQQKAKIIRDECMEEYK